MFPLAENIWLPVTLGILLTVILLVLAVKKAVRTPPTHAPRIPPMPDGFLAAKKRFEKENVRDGGVIGFGKRHLSTQDGTKKVDKLQPLFGTSRGIILSPRTLGRINRVRREYGKPMMSDRGFRAAIAHAATGSPRPSERDDFITYLLLYDLVSPAHMSRRDESAEVAIRIDPYSPYNGHGGAFGGAGASGAWEAPDKLTAAAASAISLGLPMDAGAATPGPDTGGSVTLDTGSSSAQADVSATVDPPAPPVYTPDTTPAYTPPAPTSEPYSAPTPSYDPGPSPSDGGASFGGGGGDGT